MKVIIVNSPLFRYVNKSYKEDYLPPLGLGYIATNLQVNKIDVDLFDAVAKNISLRRLRLFLKKSKPEFIAINIFTTNYQLVKKLIESLKIKTHFIIGGLSTKSLYEQILKWKTANKIDIVIGDGEKIILDIIRNNVKEQASESITNRRVYRVNKYSYYFLKDISNVPLNRDFFINETTNNSIGLKEVNLVSSRGCIYNCSFCAAARNQNQDYLIRERSENSIIDEINHIKYKYPETNSIRILDDLFLKSKVAILKAIDIFSQFDLQWRSMAHVNTFSNIEQKDILRLKESGCNELFIGIESGSQKILQSINKTFNAELVQANFEKLFRAKINIKGYFIYGFPDETIDDCEMTFKLAKELKKLSLDFDVNFRTSVFQFRPYHGTEIYKKLKEKFPNINIEQTTHNKILSNKIGRNQFNFQGNNYSQVCLKTILDYICKTNNLNVSRELFRQSTKYNRHKLTKKV